MDLCQQIHSTADLHQVARFLKTQRRAMLQQWGGQAWPRDGPAPYLVNMLDRVTATVANALAVPPQVRSGAEVQAAQEAWGAFVAYVKTAHCSGQPVKWVARQTANVPPFFGTTMCTPTAHPRVGERAYQDRSMCEYAMFRTTPNSTNYTYSTLAFPWGCGQLTGGVAPLQVYQSN